MMQFDKMAGPWQRPRPSRAYVVPTTKTSAAAKTEAAPLRGKEAARIRERIGYEGDVPRCESCVAYQAKRMLLINSLPRLFDPHCRRHHIKVAPNACCDSWAGTDGSALLLDAALSREEP